MPDSEATAGHSLGGAVATLCTLRLLGMDAEAASHIHCITFACVAIGNPEVMRMVHANGWSHLFQNFILPGAVLSARRHCYIPTSAARASQ